jgi:hypothetical protein
MILNSLWNSNQRPDSDPRSRVTLVMVKKKSDPELFFLILCCFAIFWLPYKSFNAEREFHGRMSAFHEVEDHIYTTQHCSPELSALECLKGFNDFSRPFHVKSRSDRDVVTGSVDDKDFGLSVNDTLELRRVTEYCQWHERVVTIKKSKSYIYYKAWSPKRINSLPFHQVVHFEISHAARF